MSIDDSEPRIFRAIVGDACGAVARVNIAPAVVTLTGVAATLLPPTNMGACTSSARSGPREPQVSYLPDDHHSRRHSRAAWRRQPRQRLVAGTRTGTVRAFAWKHWPARPSVPALAPIARRSDDDCPAPL
jgi:hypothetical protein